MTCKIDHEHIVQDCVYVENEWRQDRWPFVLKDKALMRHIKHVKPGILAIEDVSGYWTETLRGQVNGLLVNRAWYRPNPRFCRYVSDCVPEEARMERPFVGVAGVAVQKMVDLGYSRGEAEQIIGKHTQRRRVMAGALRRRAGRFMVWDDGTRRVIHVIFNSVDEFPLSIYGDMLGKEVRFKMGTALVAGVVKAVGCERGLLVISARTP